MSASTIADLGALALPRKRRMAPSAYLVVAACVAVMAIMAAPLVFSFLASIESKAEASAAPHYLPQTFSLQNYLKVIGYQAGLATYVGNSTLVALMTIVACIALAAPAGYGLARFSPHGKEIAFLVLLAPMMIPYQALLIRSFSISPNWGWSTAASGWRSCIRFCSCRFRSI